MDITEIYKIEDFRHHTDVQIRFNDIDILGHVNNTVYFSFYDTGKAYYFNAVRRGQMNWQEVDTVIANVNCAYIRPIIFGDKIEVYTRCESIGDKSFVLRQMLVEKNTRQIKSVCETVMVSINRESKSACSIPEEWRKQFCDYENRELTVEKNKNTI